MEVSSAATENVREKRTSHDVDLARGKRCRKIERERTAPLWLPAARSGSHGGRSPPQSRVSFTAVQEPPHLDSQRWLFSGAGSSCAS